MVAIEPAQNNGCKYRTVLDWVCFGWNLEYVRTWFQCVIGLLFGDCRQDLFQRSGIIVWWKHDFHRHYHHHWRAALEDVSCLRGANGHWLPNVFSLVKNKTVLGHFSTGTLHNPRRGRVTAFPLFVNKLAWKAFTILAPLWLGVSDYTMAEETLIFYLWRSSIRAIRTTSCILTFYHHLHACPESGVRTGTVDGAYIPWYVF